MKKWLSLVLIITIIISMGTLVFAAEPEYEVVYDLGDYKIVGKKWRVPVPHEYNGFPSDTL